MAPVHRSIRSEQEHNQMDRQDMIMICGMQIKEMTLELLRRADLTGMIHSSCRKPDPLIALKPNLLGPIPASDGATTHPQIVEGVIAYLRDAGFENVVVMESSWVGDKTSDSLLVTGFGELCSRLGVPFIDLQKDQSVPVDCAGMTLNICRRALEADYLINLPVIKGHCQTGVTCALKNMKGCIPASEKRRFHRLGLHEPIGHLCAGIRQDFILADAICPDLTFEDGGNPVTLNRLVCASDPVLMDAFAERMIGLEEGSVRYIRIAQECGVGQADLASSRMMTLYEKTDGGRITYIEGPLSSSAVSADRVCTLSETGAGALSAKGDYRSILKVKEMVCDVDSCSACYGTLIPVLHRLDAEGLLEKLPDKLCIGQGFRGQRGPDDQKSHAGSEESSSRIKKDQAEAVSASSVIRSGSIGIGNCTSGFDTYLPGCPPSEKEMERFLRELTD